MRAVAALSLLAVCAGCSTSRYASHWDGRRGYDGNGDYGYDLNASRSEASLYRARASRDYPVPGTPDDPWGPYIQDAAARFQVPARWIREVMRQESGGREYDADGLPITSGAGAMGLMQVMPGTYDLLRQRYGLGDDPYAPKDNILAGAAYIRDMYAIYGSPGFLAAYNAGPERLDAYLNDGTPLPDETTNYLASVAPRLGTDVAMSGPLAVYGGTGTAQAYAAAYVPPANAAPAGTASADDGAYAGGGMTVAAYEQLASAAAPSDPSDRAFDGGGLVTPDAPTGAYAGEAGPAAAPSPAAPQPVAPRPVAMASFLGQSAAPPPSGITAVALQAPATPPVQRAVATPSMALLPATATTAAHGGAWGVQVGAFPDPARSQAAIAAARARGGDLLIGTKPVIVAVQHAGILYRARLIGVSADTAAAVCGRLSSQGMACFTVPPGS